MGRSADNRRQVQRRIIHLLGTSEILSQCMGSAGLTIGVEDLVAWLLRCLASQNLPCPWTGVDRNGYVGNEGQQERND